METLDKFYEAVSQIAKIDASSQDIEARFGNLMSNDEDNPFAIPNSAPLAALMQKNPQLAINAARVGTPDEGAIAKAGLAVFPDTGEILIREGNAWLQTGISIDKNLLGLYLDPTVSRETKAHILNSAMNVNPNDGVKIGGNGDVYVGPVSTILGLEDSMERGKANDAALGKAKVAAEQLYNRIAEDAKQAINSVLGR